MITFYLSLIDSEDDRNKFKVIYDNYRELIIFEAGKLTKDKSLSEEIVQDTILKILEKISTLRYDSDKEFAALIGIITRNSANEIFRRNRKYVLTGIDYPEEKDSYEDREKLVVDTIVMKEIIRIIKDMDPMYSEPLRLKMRGYSSEEIADLLDISPRNARKRIQRGKRMIADKLGVK